MQIWSHCDVATMAADAAVPCGLVGDGALVVGGDRLLWVGPLVTPGPIDCHTHLGLRRRPRAGVRAAPGRGQPRGHGPGRRRHRGDGSRHARGQQLAGGVTTIEIKSGYGQEQEQERKCLRAARLLGEQEPVAVRTTCLGARAAARVRRSGRRLRGRSAAHAGLVARARTGRRGGCLLRAHRLHAVLAAGPRADFVRWDVDHPSQLAYAIGNRPHLQTIRGGTTP
jgi:imidazolonepropionase-like amidohydrolase